MDNVIIIAGPTASGKTSFAVKLAQEINGEIISADSMQIYKHMRIGTASPSYEEMKGIPHHLLNFLEPNENYSVANYQKDAFAKIEEIVSRGRVPIITGGTGLYINSLVYKLNFDDTKTDGTVRNKISAQYERYALYLNENVTMMRCSSVSPVDILVGFNVPCRKASRNAPWSPGC